MIKQVKCRELVVWSRDCSFLWCVITWVWTGPHNYGDCRKVGGRIGSLADSLWGITCFSYRGLSVNVFLFRDMFSLETYQSYFLFRCIFSSEIYLQRYFLFREFSKETFSLKRHILLREISEETHSLQSQCWPRKSHMIPGIVGPGSDIKPLNCYFETLSLKF